MDKYNTCEKCGKFVNLRIAIEEKFQDRNRYSKRDPTLKRLVCKDCSNKSDTCDICEKKIALNYKSYSTSVCIKSGCKINLKSPAYYYKMDHVHLVCVGCIEFGNSLMFLNKYCNKCGKKDIDGYCFNCNKQRNICDICERNPKTNKVIYKHFECEKSGCKRMREHQHYLCNVCVVTYTYNNCICYNCKAKRKNKKIYLHQFVNKCYINNCKEGKQHEHYLCKDCNKQRPTK